MFPDDPELNAFLDLSANMPDVTEEVPDAIGELFEAGRLDAAIGKTGAAVALRAETANLDKRASEILKRSRDAAPADWDAPLTDDSHALAKMDTPLDRRKRSYAAWLRTEMALGKTCRELIDHAAKHDLGVANLLREVAAELEAA